LQSFNLLTTSIVENIKLSKIVQRVLSDNVPKEMQFSLFRYLRTCSFMVLQGVFEK